MNNQENTLKQLSTISGIIALVVLAIGMIADSYFDDILIPTALFFTAIQVIAAVYVIIKYR